MPEKVIAQLREDLGAKAFDGLTEQERLILITAHIEITVDHNRMISMLTIHPRDLSNIFSGLVARELLIKEGTGRGTVYCLPSARARDLVNEMTDSNPSSGGLDPRPRGFEQLEIIANAVASKKKAPKSEVEDAILALCTEQPCSLEQLADLLNRSVDLVRKNYLQPLVRAKRLRYQYPTRPNHPQQMYITEDKH